MTAARATGRNARRMVAVLLFALVLVVAGWGAPGVALAQDDIGSVRWGTETFSFTNYSDLQRELEAQKSKTVTVEMHCDWSSDIATSRLIIPANAHVTLNMNGHKIDRNLTQFKDWQSDGEVIVVKAGAVFTVNGGSGNNSYEVSAYSSTDPDASPVSSTVEGALITGGASTNGAGGIHVQTGATVTLNNVTIAGCRSQKGSTATVGNVHCGYGGGMYLCGGGITVNMNNATITGCYASEDGGGIYADNSKAVAIKLVNSHIDANCAHSDGGGIDLDGKGSRITGDASMTDNGTVSGSSVSYNKSEARGGGILAWNSGITVDSVALVGNQGDNGGGIYVAQDKTLLKDLVIRGNQADKGGGVYFAPGSSDEKNYAGDTDISNCTITGNTAQTAGGGVYCDEHSAANGKRKRSLSGATVIKDNAVRNGSDYKNLCIASNYWWAKDESFNLSEGSDVWVSWVHEGSWIRLIPNKDTACAKYLHSDQSDYCFVYSIANQFIDRVILDEAPELPTTITISAASANNASGAGKSGSKTAAGKVGTVGAGGVSGNDYSLIRGFASHGGKDEVSSFYYSDGLFYSSPYAYNEHLATVSLTFAYCGGYMNNSAEKDADGNTYYNKHWGAKQFLADIGCPDQNIYVSDSMIVKPGTDSVGVTIGSKELTRADGTKTGDILIPVAVRGFGYEAEWVSNVTIGYAAEMGWQKEAKGFSEAASYVYSEIEYYVKKYDLFDAYKAGKVKFWITGYSRAGATANLTGKRLVDAIANDGCDSQVFCYPCEAPKGGTDDAETAGHNYNCIHNLINKVDIVPYVAPEQMGFKRYGVDHYIPGTPAGEVKSTVKSVTQGGAGGPSKVTMQVDNTATLTKTNAYSQQRFLMLDQLMALVPGMTFNDSFQPQALDFISTSGFMHMYSEGDNEGNRVEDFVEDFIWLLVKKSNISRDTYARYGYTLNGKTYPSIQAAARALMLINQSGDGLSGITDSAGNIKSEIPKVSFFTFWPFDGLEMTGSKAIDYSMASLYLNVVGEWGDLPDSDKAAWIRNLWNSFAKSGALNKLSADDKDKLEEVFPTVLNLALTLVDSDYNYKPKNNVNNQWAKGSNETMMYIPTFVEHASYIIQNHDQNLNLAWARSYDSWYQGDNDKDNFKLAQPGNVGVPEAFGMVDGKPKKLVAGKGNENKLASDQRITLDNEAIVGEAVYYDLYDVTAGNEKQATNRLYRGGVDLVRGDVDERTYEIVAYDMSYGVKSGTVTYRVTLTDTTHKVIVRDLAADGSGAVMSSISTAEDASAAEPDSGTGAGGLNDTGKSAVSVKGQSSGDDGPSLMTGTISPDALQVAGEGDEDYSAYRTREYTCVEGQKAIAQADVPSTRYFKTWKVEVLDKQGNVVADASETFLPYGNTSNPASFTIPKEGGTTYPQGYQLRFTAQYGKKIEEMTVQVQAPVKGQELSSPFTVQFDNGKSETCLVSWTYRHGEDQGWIPASSTVMPNTVYHAVIEVDQDWAGDILFADNVQVVMGGDDAGQVETWKAEKDSVTGSIVVWITFGATEGDDPAPSDPKLMFEVGAFDLYANQPISGISESFAAQPRDSVTLVAPNIKDMTFVKWDFSSFEQCELSDDPTKKTITFKLPNSLEGGRIFVQYAPALQKVEVNLYDQDGNLFAPEAGGTGPDRCAMSFTAGGKEFEVNPESLTLTWSTDMPEDGRFVPNVAYMGLVKAATADGPTISVREKGSTGGYEDIRIIEQPTTNVEVLFNGSAQDVSVDFARYTVAKMFPATTYELGTVKQPDNITGMSHAEGSTEDKVRGMLPATTRILTTRGIEFDADIVWEQLAITSGGEDDSAAAVWTANGTVKLPDTVTNSNKVSLDVSMTVSVEGAGTALSPTASPSSGTYLYNQAITLTANEQGGTTYYTTDGTEPTTSSTVYAGEEIYVSRAEANQYDEETGYRMFVVKAFTVSEGKRPSNVATYEYVFFDIPVPMGAQLEGNGSEQVGVEGSSFYTLSVAEGDTSGVRIDENGNAVATNPGVYKVKAHLEDASDSWQLDGRGGRSKDDQVIEFAITGEQDDLCTVAVVAQPQEGGVVAGGGTYKRGKTATVTATPNEGYAFVGWMEGTSTVAKSQSYSFKVDGGCLLAANFARVLTVKWLDGDGSELYSATYNEGDNEPTYKGDKTPTRRPTAAYSYKFSGWDSGKVSDTVKTYKPLFDAIPNKYSVTFVDEDGTILKAPVEYAYDTLPKNMDIPHDPEKPGTAQYSYAFDKWVNAETGEDLGPVTADATYKATYTATLNEYEVTFKNYNGEVLQSGAVAYGSIPSYKGEVPKRASVDQCSYVFNGWSPEIKAVTGAATYTAMFMELPVPISEKKGALYFDFAGGTLDGKASLTIVANVDEIITIPNAPTKDGYEFKYWKGSEYHPGDKYTVEGDHAFTAVWEQKAAFAPTATLETGEYLFNQQTKLDVHGQNGTTYYTTDGSDPTTSSTRQVYGGNAILVDRSVANQAEKGTGRKVFVLKAYTAVAGMNDSDVVTYEYVFSDIPVPQGEALVYTGKEQTGVVRTPFYTLEPIGKSVASIDYKGNAVATDPGVYQVKAKLDPSSGAERWATNDGKGWSDEDQTVKFEIKAKKKSQTIKAKKNTTKVFKASKKTKRLAKKKTINLKKLAKVSAKTSVKFKKANKTGGRKIVVNAKTGKVTLKKGLKAKKYKVKVKLTAPTNKTYKAAKAKTITLKVIIKT